tara:strand:- start:5348 stop:6205 length:858 start_codon:yes stop_codon:yes gene_type:complete
MSFLLCPKYIGSRGSSFEINNLSVPGNENFYSSGGINYKSVWFDSSGTIEITDDGVVDIMVVSGGGGGTGSTSSPEGGMFGGGGGAGGMVVQTNIPVTAGTGIMSVAGGSAVGVSGQNSSVLPSLFTGVTQSIGGGTNAQPGGSGGGANVGNHGGVAGAPGTPGQGHPGGSAPDRDSNSQGGGGAGGGAGAPGGPSSRTSSGAGGAGLENAYATGNTGDWYAGGGGGCTGHYGIQTRGAGGQGGGGGTMNSAEWHGDANTGGGGVAGGGQGGSGIIVVRYNLAQP